jgi:hypothetical protein
MSTERILNYMHRQMTESTKDNLCDLCNQQCNFPECLPSIEDVEYGDGVGYDNIIYCENYQQGIF